MRLITKKYNQKAFSLIELSIVILIIGILVAGVTSSSRLIKRMKLITAQNLTNSSPIYTIKDLVFWYETSLEKSFIDSEEQDNSDISIWYDNNIQSTSKLDAITIATNNRPKYIENVFNGIPAIRFDGNDDYMRVNSVGISGPQLTFFIVYKRNAVKAECSFVTGVNLSTLDYDNIESFIPGYEGSGGYFMIFRNGGLSTINPHLGNNVIHLVSSVFTGSLNTIYLNGTAYPSVASSGNFNVRSVFIGSRWYNSAPNCFYSGDLAELIIFNRALKDEERKSIEQYLGKKFSLKIN
jgi:prepilin-type N-terminal cleavage/methylation domain-containing protein